MDVATPVEHAVTPLRNLRKTRVGVVKSAKMEKSIVVKVTRRVKHKLYGKYITRTNTFMAEDAKNECRTGDTVKIMETRPISKNKRWRLVEIIHKADIVD